MAATKKNSTEKTEEKLEKQEEAVSEEPQAETKTEEGAESAATSTEKKAKPAKKAGPKKAKAKEQAEAVEQPPEEAEGEKEEKEEKPAAKVARPKRGRSKKYQAVRAKIDRTRSYDPFAAIELVKKLSYSKFTGTISTHITVREVGLSREIALPHSTGQTRQIEIASDETIKKIEAGQVDFEVLLATPQFMSKITKYAPILGPKGLMPNPKNGTLTPNPEQRKQELEAGTRVLRTERKAPLIHVPIGNTEMETEKLVENLRVLLKAFKGKIKKVVLSATMSPGVKVEWEE